MGVTSCMPLVRTPNLFGFTACQSSSEELVRLLHGIDTPLHYCCNFVVRFSNDCADCCCEPGFPCWPAPAYNASVEVGVGLALQSWMLAPLLTPDMAPNNIVRTGYGA